MVFVFCEAALGFVGCRLPLQQKANISQVALHSPLLAGTHHSHCIGSSAKQSSKQDDMDGMEEKKQTPHSTHQQSVNGDNDDVFEVSTRQVMI